jgi:hypothetical protein
VYNLKEAMLAKCYIEVLGLDRHSATATRLIKWKQPVEGEVRSYLLRSGLELISIVQCVRGLCESVQTGNRKAVHSPRWSTHRRRCQLAIGPARRRADEAVGVCPYTAKDQSAVYGARAGVDLTDYPERFVLPTMNREKR